LIEKTAVVNLKNVTSILLRVAVFFLFFFSLYSWMFFSENGYLPYPFFYNKNDTFMDFFNINYSALGGDGKYITPEYCNTINDSFELRDCNLNVLFYSLLPPLLISLFVMWWKSKRGLGGDVYWWILLFLFSFPLAYGFERGNYIFYGFLFLTIYVFFESKWYALLPLCITSKYYLIALLLPYLRWRKKMLLCAILALIINVALALQYGDAGWVYIPKYILNFSGGVSNWREAIYAPTSIFAFSTVLNFIPSYSVEFLFRIALFILKFTILMDFIACVSRIDCRSAERRLWVGMLALIFLEIITPAAGLYSLMLLYPFFIYFAGKNLLSEYQKILAILLALPYPIQVGWVENQTFKNLLHEAVVVNVGLGFQTFIPLMLLIVLYWDVRKAVLNVDE